MIPPEWLPLGNLAKHSRHTRSVSFHSCGGVISLQMQEVTVKFMSIRAIILSLAFGSAALSLSACGHSPLTRALTGGALGAGAGAAVGAATGGNAGTGALVGGGIGAAGGALTAP